MPFTLITSVQHAAWCPQYQHNSLLMCRKSEDDKKGPFFLFSYADDDILVARGRGGGVAFWQAVTPTWEAESGVDL